METLCVEKDNADPRGTTVEGLVLPLVFCSRQGRSIQGERTQAVRLSKKLPSLANNFLPSVFGPDVSAAPPNSVEYTPSEIDSRSADKVLHLF